MPLYQVWAEFAACLVVIGYRVSIYRRAGQGHVLSAGFGVVLLGFVGFSLLLGKRLPWSIGHVGAYTPIIILLYLIAVRAIFLYENSRSSSSRRKWRTAIPAFPCAARWRATAAPPSPWWRPASGCPSSRAIWLR